MVFKSEEVLKLIEAKTPEELTALAIDMLKRRAKKVAIVCGPISTGNQRRPEENRRRIVAIMSALQRQDVVVFDHLIFLKLIERMRKIPHYQDRSYVREIFHVPLLESGWIQTIYFTLEWRGSDGANWYHARAKEFGIDVKVVQPNHQMSVE